MPSCVKTSHSVFVGLCGKKERDIFRRLFFTKQLPYPRANRLNLMLAYFFSALFQEWNTFFGMCLAEAKKTTRFHEINTRRGYYAEDIG